MTYAKHTILNWVVKIHELNRVRINFNYDPVTGDYMFNVMLWNCDTKYWLQSQRFAIFPRFECELIHLHSHCDYKALKSHVIP